MYLFYPARSDLSRLTGGCWSPTRHSLFFVTKEDGVVEAWDLLYNYGEPLAVKTLSNTQLTCLKVWSSAKNQSREVTIFTRTNVAWVNLPGIKAYVNKVSFNLSSLSAEFTKRGILGSRIPRKVCQVRKVSPKNHALCRKFPNFQKKSSSISIM